MKAFREPAQCATPWEWEVNWTSWLLGLVWVGAIRVVHLGPLSIMWIAQQPVKWKHAGDPTPRASHYVSPPR